MTEMRWSQRMSLKHLAMAMLDSLAIRVVHTVAEGVVTTAGGSELRSGKCGSGSWSSLLPSPALASIFSAVSGGAMSHPRAVGLPLEQYKLASRRI